ncbi:TPA: hypothetical protein ACNFPT_004506 [Enterobacter ludwigii]
MFYVAEALIVILVIFIFLHNRQKTKTFQNCLAVAGVLAALGTMHLIHVTLKEEYGRARDVTFYDADHQLTVGIYCINNHVMYREKDSVRRTDYPLQDFNDNAYKGTLSTRMSCANGVFLDAEGNAIGRNRVLKIVTENVLTGFLPFTASTSGESVSH